MSVYLDHNATAPLSAASREALQMWIAEEAGNPSSVHRAGRRARAVVEAARRDVAASIGARASEIIFTSGATEAIHLAIRSFVRAGEHVVCSAVEHPAVYGALEVAGAEVQIVPVDSLGRLRPADFQSALRDDTRLVVVMGAQNEIGNRYPIAEISECVSPVPVFCDAVQLYGKAKVDVGRLGCHALSLSGHKVGAPTGIGALWLKTGLESCPNLRGGPQERGRRAGTENVMGIVGLGAASRVIDEQNQCFMRVAQLRDHMQEELIAKVPRLVIHGDQENRLANTLSFRIEGVQGDLVLQALDLEGYEISSGSACSSGGVEPSAVLLALGLSHTQAQSGLRVSLGPDTQAASIDSFVASLARIVERIEVSLEGRRA